MTNPVIPMVFSEFEVPGRSLLKRPITAPTNKLKEKLILLFSNSLGKMFTLLSLKIFEIPD